VLAACARFSAVSSRMLRDPRRAVGDIEPNDPGAANTEPVYAQASRVKDVEVGSAAFDPRRQLGVTRPLGFFDPIGICPKDETVFNEYRACEIKHGRVAMLATVGAIVQHYIRFPGFTYTNFGKPLPAGLGAVTETPGSFGFAVIFFMAGILELVFWKDGIDAREGKWSKEPGNFGDPLGLGQYNQDMRNRELNNGRMAMFAALGIIFAELATGKDAVEQLGL